MDHRIFVEMVTQMRSFGYARLVFWGLVVLVCLAGQASSYEFGSKVFDGDADLNNLLYNTSPILRFWDANSNGFYDNSDVVYLSWNTPLTVIAADIRISPFGDLRSGSQVKSSDSDWGNPLTNFSPTPQIVYIDNNTNGWYDLGDPVYYDIKPNNTIIDANDIRLTPMYGLAAGTKVGGGDQDNGRTRVVLDYVMRFYNKNGDYVMPWAPIYDTGDLIYIDVSTLCIYDFHQCLYHGHVVANDVRLSTTQPP